MLSKASRPLSIPAALGCLLALAVSQGRAELERHPIEMGTSIDVGKVVKGQFGNIPADGQILTRTGVYLTESGTYNKKLDIHLTIGGLFWFPEPYQKNFQNRIIRFGPGVGQAQAVYAFGDAGNPWAHLQLGLFPLKYNPDAKNLGEYLFRSGTYPGYLWTGGWSYINSASYLAQGLRFTLPTLNGKVTHEASLTMERDIEPAHDLSPSYMITAKPSSAFEFGAGVEWAHGIALQPDTIVTPNGRDNAYNKATGKPLLPADIGKPGYSVGDTAIVPDNDPRIGQAVPGRVNTVYTDTAGNGTPKDQLGYYTFRGFKAMARASMDIGDLIGSEAIAAGTFKLYGEIGVLGIKNQPFYYDKLSERMPIMFGINIPTFKLLDMLSFEMEYHKSRFPNTIVSAFDNQLAIPVPPSTDWRVYDTANPAYKEVTKDDWHWSLYARREVYDGIRLYAQVASDHLRHIDPEVKPLGEPTTVRPGEWYYVMRLEFGI